MVNKEERWGKNLEHLMSGGFGDTTRAETLLDYWYAQERAGYPYASENVKYFEEMVGIERKPLKIKKIYESIEITDEMHKIVNEMQEAISDECCRRVLEDERKLEAALRENGWCKSSDVVKDIIETLTQLKDDYLLNGETTKATAIFYAIGLIEEEYTEDKK